MLFLLACMLLGSAVIIYQKSARKLPPRLSIETLQVTSQAAASTRTVTSTPPARALRLNLNTAPADSLELLPGIGPDYAAAIVAYRQAHGRFQKIDDVVNVRGIGPKTLLRIRNQITVE